MKKYLPFFIIILFIITTTCYSSPRNEPTIIPMLSHDEYESLLEILPTLQYACEIFDSPNLRPLRLLCSRLIHNDCNIPSILIGQALGNLALVLRENKTVIFDSKGKAIFKRLINSLLYTTAKESNKKLPTRGPKVNTTGKILAPAISQQIISGVTYVLSSSGIAGGDVIGPSNSTNNAIALFSGNTGKIIQSSGITIDNSAIAGIAQLDIGNLRLTDNTISSINANGNINVSPNGTGTIILDGLSWPISDGATGTFLTTDGAGSLSFSIPSGGGDVVGPSSSTNSAIVRYNGTSGKVIQNTGIIIDNDNNVTGVNALECQEAVVPSDLNLKESIKNITPQEGLNNIMKLRPVTFVYKNRPDKDERGFIAQEVQQVLPSLVIKTNEGHLAVNYQKLVVDLVAAVQQLQKNFEKQERPNR